MPRTASLGDPMAQFFEKRRLSVAGHSVAMDALFLQAWPQGCVVPMLVRCLLRRRQPRVHFFLKMLAKAAVLRTPPAIPKPHIVEPFITAVPIILSFPQSILVDHCSTQRRFGKLTPKFRPLSIKSVRNRNMPRT